MDPANAGAWLQEKGHGQVITTTLHYRADSFNDAAGNPASQDPFSKFELNPYVEYGATSWLTLGGNLLLDAASSSVNPFGEREDYYAAEAELFARLPLWRGEKTVVSIQPLLRLPTLYFNDDAQSRDADSYDRELSLLYGQSFQLFGLSHFLDTGIGYRLRSGTPRDQYRAYSTFGTHLGERWTVLAQHFSTFSQKIPTGAALTQRAEDDYDLVKLQLSAVYEIDESWSVQLGGFRHVYGRNTGLDGGVFSAVWWRF